MMPNDVEIPPPLAAAPPPEFEVPVPGAEIIPVVPQAAPSEAAPPPEAPGFSMRTVPAAPPPAPPLPRLPEIPPPPPVVKRESPAAPPPAPSESVPPKPWDSKMAETIGRAVNEHLEQTSPDPKDHSEAGKTAKSPEDMFEKLYNLNPERFAQMPTPEFMKLARELEAFDHQMSEAQSRLDEAKAGREELLKKYDLHSA